jgi:HK97 family phage major capsid protein
MDGELLSKMEGDLRAFVSRHQGKNEQLDARLRTLEQAFVARPGAPGLPMGYADDSLGALITRSEGFSALQKGARQTGKIGIGNFHTKVVPPIINSPGPLQPLVPDVRIPGIIMPGLRPLTIRDLLSQNRTQSNLIQYTREDSFTNSAAPVAESIDKPQSGLTFSLHNAPVQTIASWLAASRQIIDDAPALEDYVNTRLLYGLKLVEEDQFLNGNGTGQNISGLLINATAYSGSLTGTKIDILANAIEQVGASGFTADAVVVSLKDFWGIVTTKNSFGGYILLDPQSTPNPRVWGLPLVVSQKIADGTFLVGNFRLGAAIWDRQDASVEISREHASFFVQNMVAILCEERVALTVFRSLAFVSGSFPASGS